MEQHVLIDYELDPDLVADLASGRTGGWLGRRRATRAVERRSVIRPVWPIVLLAGLLIGGIRAVAVVPAALWVPMLLDLLRLMAIALPVAVVIALGMRRLRQRR
jgi:hypothetical protein